MAEIKNTFIHHVFFWLKNPASQSDFDRLVAGLKKLSAAPSIRDWHIGIPADTNREVIERSYSVSWLVSFDGPAEQEAYQSDPIHLEFVRTCSMLWSRVLVHDTVNYTE